jgi:hypothetical protein
VNCFRREDVAEAGVERHTRPEQELQPVQVAAQIFHDLVSLCFLGRQPVQLPGPSSQSLPFGTKLDKPLLNEIACCLRDVVEEIGDLALNGLFFGIDTLPSRGHIPRLDLQTLGN